MQHHNITDNLWLLEGTFSDDFLNMIILRDYHVFMEAGYKTLTFIFTFYLLSLITKAITQCLDSMLFFHSNAFIM